MIKKDKMKCREEKRYSVILLIDNLIYGIAVVRLIVRSDSPFQKNICPHGKMYRDSRSIGWYRAWNQTNRVKTASKRSWTMIYRASIVHLVSSREQLNDS